MDLDLVGRRAAVMASSDGIGKAIACALAREGVHVMMCGRDDAKLAAAMDEAKAIAREGAQVAGERIDLGTAHGPALLVESAATAFGGLDILVTNTGGPPAGPLLSFDDEAWQKAFESVLLSVARGARAALPHLEASAQGRIVSIASSSIKATLPDARLLQRLPAGHPRARQDARGGARSQGHHRQPDRARQDRHRARALARRRARRAQRHERATTCAPPPSARSRSAATATRWNWPRSRCSSAPRPGATSPARRRWSTAASCERFDRARLGHAARPRPPAHRRALHDVGGAPGADSAGLGGLCAQRRGRS